MSSGKSSKENASLQSTRQMLDELDALMERMLALPVSDGDATAAEALPPATGKPHLPLPRVSERVGPPSVLRMPKLSATLTVVEAPDSEQKPAEKKPAEKKAHVQKAGEKKPHAKTAKKLLETQRDHQAPSYDADSWEQRDAGESAPAKHPFEPHRPIVPFLPPLEPIPEDAIPPSILSLPTPDSMPPLKPLKWRRPRRPMGNLALLPLVLVNGLFDSCTMLLGWPGRLLRSRGGKNFLGLTGLALLAWAGLWLLKDWLGWTW